MPTKPQPKHAILSAYQDEPELASLSAHPPAGRRGAFKALFKPAALAVACTLFLAACSSSNDPGSLIEASQAVGTLPRAALDASSAAALVGAAAKCDVQVIGLNYLTRGVNGEPTNASGVLLMPSGSDAACKGPLPLLAYGRGTEVSKGRALASLSDGESGALAAFFAGQGYAVVASDYLGYAKSAYSYHPYLHSDTEASATIDAIRAARQVAREKGQALSGKLMLYGYSQGGHSSMSTHKAIETDPALSAEMGLVAAAHGAAPSALSTALQAAEPVLYGQIFITFAVTAWQKVYGNVYAKPSDAFKAPYADGIESILPSATTNFDGLLAQNKVSQDLGSGWLNAMFTDSFLNDLKNNANSGVIQAAKKNDLVASSWTPKSPTLLCAGSGDPVVPYKSAQALAAAKWKGLSNVTVVDVDAQARGFAQQLWAGQTASQKAGFGNSIDVYTRFNYHGTLAPPLCLSAVKSVFDKLK